MMRPINCSLHERVNKVYFVELMNKVSFSFQFLINLSNTYLSLVSSLEGYINAMAHEQIDEQVLMSNCERMSKCSCAHKDLFLDKSPVEGQKVPWRDKSGPGSPVAGKRTSPCYCIPNNSDLNSYSYSE